MPQHTIKQGKVTKLINNLSMRGKPITLVVPALLVIVFFAVESLALNYGEPSNMRQLLSKVELAEAGDPLTDALHGEHGRSAVFLASSPGTDAGLQLMPARRKRGYPETDSPLFSLWK
ncbi:hypothetical protein [Marinobacter sp. es.048]|uniref:hypothetical protein n=1 Tax=Marinobacter sp. es.048 TaxID=1761795 RepID=UPI001C0ECC0E|nr:hypothetical protein [Marinobacter sp. es.048]